MLLTPCSPRPAEEKGGFLRCHWLSSQAFADLHDVIPDTSMIRRITLARGMGDRSKHPRRDAVRNFFVQSAAALHVCLNGRAGTAKATITSRIILYGGQTQPPGPVTAGGITWISLYDGQTPHALAVWGRLWAWSREMSRDSRR